MTKSVLCRLAAIAILVAGGVHFDLWLEHGYRGVHVIGPLFLLNAIAAVATPQLIAALGEAAAIALLLTASASLERTPITQRRIHGI